MKKLQLLLGIALVIVTTIIDVMFPFIAQFSNLNLALMCLLSAVGYLAAFLLIDDYLKRHEIYHYFRGFDARSAIEADRINRDKKPRFDLSKSK